MHNLKQELLIYLQFTFIRQILVYGLFPLTINLYLCILNDAHEFYNNLKL